MSNARIILRHKESGQRTSLGPGDFIGRSDVATLCLDDPRISEAHAMISLRDRQLQLIALRGRFRHDGKVLTEVRLTQGMELELAHDVTLICEQVEMPRTLLGLLIDDELEITLTNTMTLYADTVPTLKRGYAADGDAIFWSTGSSWRMRIADDPACTLKAGDTFTVRGASIKIISIPVERAAYARTRDTLRAPLLFKPHSTCVEVQPEGGEPMIVSGVPGKILASLLQRHCTASWQEIIDDVWPEDASTLSALRRRFDAGLRRLRDHLRGVLPEHEELIKLDGTGVVLLTLSPQDRLILPNHDQEAEEDSSGGQHLS